MPACRSGQGGSHRRGGAASAANERITLIGRLTKEHERAQFIAEYLRRLRGAAHGERVYMRVGYIFKGADVIDLNEWQAARRNDGSGTDHGQ
jgi:hypothetical protein